MMKGTKERDHARMEGVALFLFFFLERFIVDLKGLPEEGNWKSIYQR